MGLGGDDPRQHPSPSPPYVRCDPPPWFCGITAPWTPGSPREWGLGGRLCDPSSSHVSGHTSGTSEPSVAGRDWVCTLGPHPSPSRHDSTRGCTRRVPDLLLTFLHQNPPTPHTWDLTPTPYPRRPGSRRDLYVGPFDVVNPPGIRHVSCPVLPTVSFGTSTTPRPSTVVRGGHRPRAGWTRCRELSICYATGHGRRTAPSTHPSPGTDPHTPVPPPHAGRSEG